MTPTEIEGYLAVLYAWRELAAMTAQHIVGCPTCLLAEALGGYGYCAKNDELWAAQCGAEAKAQAILPILQAAGIETQGFETMKQRETRR